MISNNLFVALLGLSGSTLALGLLEEHHRSDFQPRFVNTLRGLEMVAPESSFVARSGPSKVSFIDPRYDEVTARTIKEQIERAKVQNPGEYIHIDGRTATAEVRDATTGETVFTFNPAHARLFFAREMNKRNPELQLPERATSGDWEVAYSNGQALVARCVGEPPCDPPICRKICKMAIDTPRAVGESDASYYKRMDQLHWSD
ncbi:hypothetical protein NLG97_g4038 [Lecanicillium saksenae]|uniref:Uncharacterized protein n=1 Tax=Lecanicillium saksenae TaxID=468837 RepID=A0ACC1QXL5_9HYPO|nr:hypothetical protein NLG97_g4038 [Lecanicillium saksenae]